MPHCSLLIAHCSLLIAKVRLVPTTQVDPLLEESIELCKMLGRSLKTLATRADLAAATNPNASQCLPMSNEQ